MSNVTSLVGDNPEIIAPFLCAMFSRLDEADVLWAVMRGWERLPEWTRYDVDILVAEKDTKKALDIAEKVGLEHGWIHYGQLNFGDMRSAWFLKNGDEATCGQSYLRLDFIKGFSYRGVSAMNTDDDLKARIRTDKGFWRMPDGHAGAIVLLKQVLSHGEVDSAARKKQVLAGLNDPQFKKILTDVVGKEIAGELCEAVSNEDWGAIKTVSPRIKKRYFSPTPRHLFQTARYAFSLIWKQLFPFLHCLVVFIGPDGCGKTTVADAVERRFKDRPFTSMMRIRMGFGMPRIRNLIAKLVKLFGKEIKNKEEPKPGTLHMGMQPPHSFLRSVSYVTYYGFGLLFGHLKLLCWRAFSGLIIADRYFYDYYYMRGYAKCPRWFIRIMELLAPRPDIVFVLERPAKDIYFQKPELTVEEIERQQQIIRDVFAHRRNVRIIDASNGVDRTVSAAVSEIEKWLIEH